MIALLINNNTFKERTRKELTREAQKVSNSKNLSKEIVINVEQNFVKICFFVIEKTDCCFFLISFISKNNFVNENFCFSRSNPPFNKSSCYL
jgi:hypothetical protein